MMMKKDTNIKPPRERIIDAAIDLLAVHGLDGMTMRQLGTAVGLDNSSLYRHFENKATLVNAALDRVAEETLAAVGPKADISQPITLKAFEDICAAAAVHFFDHTNAARLIVHWIMSMGADGPVFGVSVLATDKSRPGGILAGLIDSWLNDGVSQNVLRDHQRTEAFVILLGAVLIRPATFGHLLTSMEPKRSRATARKKWEEELRAVVRGAFTP